ncbi:MAG TPA: hypothetical protein VFO73_09860 [Candidatus Limnocylindrales bacterium]|nr:hypothetical protein [Candidatus Limnocylindrales bacterium]
MFVVNPSDPSLSFPIRYVGDPAEAVPVRRRGSRRLRGAAAALGIAVAIVAGGAVVSGQAARPSAGGPVPGEFRLGPGNQVPPGVVVPLRGSAGAPVPGEFRLAPGNQVPPGVIVPLR